MIRAALIVLLGGLLTQSDAPAPDGLSAHVQWGQLLEILEMLRWIAEIVITLSFTIVGAALSLLVALNRSTRRMEASFGKYKTTNNLQHGYLWHAIRGLHKNTDLPEHLPDEERE
jgi:hypothetical protein